MKRVFLSKAAVADLEAIDDYTIEHFGLDQAIRTSERFLETSEPLGEMPRSGQLREEISPPGREFRYRTMLGSFVVVYEAADDNCSPSWSATPGTTPPFKNSQPYGHPPTRTSLR